MPRLWTRLALAARDEATMNAERVIPLSVARRSISSIWLRRAVMLDRCTFPPVSTLTKKATALFIAGSLARASSGEGSGMASPSSIMPSIWNAHASEARSRASSGVFPHPEKSGKLTPNSEFGSLCRYAMYSITSSRFGRRYRSLIPACFSILLNVPTPLAYARGSEAIWNRPLTARR